MYPVIILIIINIIYNNESTEIALTAFLRGSNNMSMNIVQSAGTRLYL